MVNPNLNAGSWDDLISLYHDTAQTPPGYAVCLGAALNARSTGDVHLSKCAPVTGCLGSKPITAVPISPEATAVSKSLASQSPLRDREVIIKG